MKTRYTSQRGSFRALPATTLVAVLLPLLATPCALAGGKSKVSHRPIMDFVEAQGTFCIGAPGDCFLFVPPIQNFLGWTDPGEDPDSRDDDLRISVDYAGLADLWISDESAGTVSFGTSFHGSVKQVDLGNGLTKVKAILKTKNALTWVVEGGNFNNDLVFGARAPDVLDDGASPALGDSLFIVEFVHAASPEDPLPDLLELLIAPEEGEEVLSMRFHAWAHGELSDGSGAHASVHQVAPSLDKFTVENIGIQPVGK